MKIGIANDHRGVELKKEITNYLESINYEVVNYGSDTKEIVDYSVYGIILGEAVRDKKVDYGIAICGSAIGISIACNKVKGIRCGKINNIEEAIHGKERDFVNIIALSGDTMSKEEAVDIVKAFLTTDTSTIERYQRRKEQIERYENER